MIDKAIKKITDEMMATPEEKRSLAIMFEEHLTEMCTNERIAEKILNPEKSLKKFTEDIFTQARAKAKGKCLHWADSELIDLLEDYYELNVQTSSDAIDVMDLL